MSELKFNTDAIKTAAEKIKMYNNQIHDNFSMVQTAITQLNNYWESEATATAVSKFHEINTKFVDTRNMVLNNYVNFLYQQIGEGYDKTEEINKSLAEQFK